MPDLADEEVAFAVADVCALKTAVAMQESGVIDPDTLLALARAMGQDLARLAEAGRAWLAEAQVDTLRTLSNGMTVEQATVATLAPAVATLPQLEELVLSVWRRQFAAATARSLATARDCGQPVLAVGFVDLVDFTGSTRSWCATELERTLERFDRRRLAAGRGGRWPGHQDPRGRRALGHRRPGERGRGGARHGRGARGRRSDEARPGTVLVDDAAATALSTVPAYVVKGLRRRSVRGDRSLTPHLLRRSADYTSA